MGFAEGERPPRRGDLRNVRPNPMAQHPVLSFDTHAAVVSLVDSGMPERQAETVVRLQVRLIEQHFATKADVDTVNSTVESVQQGVTDKIESVRQEFTDKIESVRQEFTDKIESVRQELTDKIESVRREFTDKIESVRKEFDGKLESIRQEVKADLASLKSELVKWMIGTNLAFATLLIAAIKVF